MKVDRVDQGIAGKIVVDKHYLHRKPPIAFAFAIYDDNEIKGILTLGTPPSRHLQISVCPTAPCLVLELNRLWVCDSLPRNTESWFIAKALKMIPPFIVCSYADTREGHVGYVYRATNWHYAGLTDRDRKTPRFDYTVPGKHSRDAFRGDAEPVKVRRKPKHRYWKATGNRRQRRNLETICTWPSEDWK